MLFQRPQRSSLSCLDGKNITFCSEFTFADGENRIMTQRSKCSFKGPQRSSLSCLAGTNNMLCSQFTFTDGENRIVTQGSKCSVKGPQRSSLSCLDGKNKTVCSEFTFADGENRIMAQGPKCSFKGPHLFSKCLHAAAPRAPSMARTKCWRICNCTCGDGKNKMVASKLACFSSDRKSPAIRQSTKQW